MTPGQHPQRREGDKALPGDCGRNRRLSVHGSPHRAIEAGRDKNRGCAPALIEATALFGPLCYKQPQTVIGDGLVIHGEAQIANIWFISPVRNGEALAREPAKEFCSTCLSAG